MSFRIYSLVTFAITFEIVKSQINSFNPFNFNPFGAQQQGNIPFQNPFFGNQPNTQNQPQPYQFNSPFFNSDPSSLISPFNPQYQPNPSTNFQHQPNPSTNFQNQGSPQVQQQAKQTFSSYQPSSKIEHKTSKERISAQKCKEYIVVASETSYSGPLALGASPQTSQTEKCEFSQGLIVGGMDAKPGEFPHMAAIGFKKKNSAQIYFGCGASLISERYVLTAAHCRKTDGLTPALVRLGDLNLNEKESFLPEIDYAIEQFISHENYNPQTHKNDIAVVRLNKNVKFLKELRPACLATSDGNSQGKQLIATGWGLTESLSQQTPDILQKVRIGLVSNSRCNEYYKDENINIDSEKQICAGEAGKDTCQGDSGGPLQVPSSISKCIFTIIGVTSFGSKDCGSKNSVGVYTNVFYYLDWIEQKVWG